MKARKYHKQGGFTLVEIIVSVGIFAAVVTVSVSALIVLNNASREARAVRVTMDNANQAVESVTRSARMGFQFDAGCTQGTSTQQTASSMIDGTNAGAGTTCISFYAPDKTGSGVARYMYRASSTWMERSTDRGVTWLRMTAPEVNMSSLKFYVNGSTQDNNQPFITLIMRGVITTTKVNMPFAIQASADPRTPNSSLIYKNNP